MLPQDAGQLPGVDAADAGHVLGLEVGVQRILAAEVGGGVTQLPDHIAPDAAPALKVRLNDAVVADEGEGLGDDLSVVAGVGQRLQIAAHTGGEHQLTYGVAIGADAQALKDLTVGQNQVCFLHSHAPFFLKSDISLLRWMLKNA